MHRILILLLLTISPLGTARAQDAVLLSGPMVGHTTASSAHVWVETTHPANVRVRYWVDAGRRPLSIRTAEGRTAQAAPHTGVVTLGGLEGGSSVHYELEIDGRPIRPQTPQVFNLPPTDREAPSFSVAFASCMSVRAYPIQPVWEQVALYRPDFLMLIGDNNYMPNQERAYDTSDEAAAHVMAGSHRYLRDVPGLRTLLAATPTYAVWDDHDYGPNNADRTFRWRELSLELFKKYWPNPAAGTPETPGIFHSFRVGDVEFFMIDDRYYRDPNEDPNRRTMLGDDQLAWLKDGLKASTATFKVIVSGTMMVPDKRNQSEYWGIFGDERDRFLHWMYDEDISGVFFISGDIHKGSVTRREFIQEGYPLWELTSSNAGVNHWDAEDLRQQQITGVNRRFSGPIIDDVFDFNFGVLEFSGPAGDRVAILKLIDYYGDTRFVHRLTEKDLSSHWRD